MKKPKEQYTTPQLLIVELEEEVSFVACSSDGICTYPDCGADDPCLTQGCGSSDWGCGSADETCPSADSYECSYDDKGSWSCSSY